MIATPLLLLFVAVNFTLHPTVLDCRLAPSAIAEWLRTERTAGIQDDEDIEVGFAEVKGGS